MGKAILVLVLIFAAVVGYLVFTGFKRAGSGDAPDKESAAKTAKDGKESKPGDELFNRASKEAGALARTGEKGLQDATAALKEKFDLTLVPAVIEVKRGETVEVKVIRGMKDLPALKLKLKAAEGSQLTVSGGEFAAGKRETTVTIEAPKDAKVQDVSLTLQHEDHAKIVPVRIK